MKSLKIKWEARGEGHLSQLSREFLDPLLSLSYAERLPSPTSWPGLSSLPSSPISFSSWPGATRFLLHETCHYAALPSLPSPCSQESRQLLLLRVLKAYLEHTKLWKGRGTLQRQKLPRQAIKVNISIMGQSIRMCPWNMMEMELDLCDLPPSSPIMRQKTSDKFQLGNILQNPWSVSLQTVKAVKNKESLRNCHRRSWKFAAQAMSLPQWSVQRNSGK